MKTILNTVLLLLILSVVCIQPASSLSVVFCEEDTIECKVQNCHTGNALTEWDNPGSELKDCDKLESELKGEQSPQVIFVSIGVLLLIAIGLYLIMPNKKRLKKKSKEGSKK